MARGSSGGCGLCLGNGRSNLTLRRCANFAAAKDIEELLVVATTKSIVFFAAIVLIEVSLEPLAELKVVQGTGLHQLGHIDVPLDAVLVEGLLEDLVVVDELVLSFGTPLDALEWERAWVEGVEHSAVDRASRTLLNLCELQL